MNYEFNRTPTPEELSLYYTLSNCTEAPIPQTCQKCNTSFIARGTFFIYKPNPAGELLNCQQFTELHIAANLCEKCR